MRAPASQSGYRDWKPWRDRSLKPDEAAPRQQRAHGYRVRFSPDTDIPD